MSRFRLPFRLKVPERDDLIAFGLATLAVGLMVGLAIGPIISGSANVITLVVPGASALPGDLEQSETTSTPVLSSPAGSEVLADEGPDSITLVAAPQAVVPVPSGSELEPMRYVEQPDLKPKKEKPEPDPKPEPKPDGVKIEGTVLASAPSSRTYWLSSDGELATVFASSVPDPGLVISTHVSPLSNGTLVESAPRSAVDLSKQGKVKAVVSFLDPVVGVAVLSSRGASLPVWTAEQTILDGIDVGEKVEAELDLNVPDPKNFSQVETGVDPEELPIRLESLLSLGKAAPVEITGELVAADVEAGSLSIAADSTGALGSVVDVVTPEGFPFELTVAGRRYSLTAEATDQGLRVIGLSPASGKAAANDRTRAFGTHAG